MSRQIEDYLLLLFVFYSRHYRCNYTCSCHYFTKKFYRIMIFTLLSSSCVYKHVLENGVDAAALGVGDDLYIGSKDANPNLVVILQSIVVTNSVALTFFWPAATPSTCFIWKVKLPQLWCYWGRQLQIIMRNSNILEWRIVNLKGAWRFWF